MKIIKLYYDTETTGLKINQHSIHQISGWIEVSGQVVEKFDIKTHPHPKAKYDSKALLTCRVTEAQLKKYQNMKKAHKQLIGILSKYVDRFNKLEKMHLVGFRNSAFDDDFLRAWFKQNGDEYFGSYFFSGSVDVSALAAQYLLNRRYHMENFKLQTVAKELGIYIDEDKLHDASYDVELTHDIYQIVAGYEEEL